MQARSIVYAYKLPHFFVIKLLDTVLSNFTKIDTNHDGRITQSEINAYRINEELKDVKEKYPRINPTQMSMFIETDVSNDTQSGVGEDKVFG